MSEPESTEEVDVYENLVDAIRLFVQSQVKGGPTFVTDWHLAYCFMGAEPDVFAYGSTQSEHSPAHAIQGLLVQAQRWTAESFYSYCEDDDE